jgi:hypothetical protein
MDGDGSVKDREVPGCSWQARLRVTSVAAVRSLTTASQVTGRYFAQTPAGQGQPLLSFPQCYPSAMGRGGGGSNSSPGVQAGNGVPASEHWPTSDRMALRLVFCQRKRALDCHLCHTTVPQPKQSAKTRQGQEWGQGENSPQIPASSHI